jgi:putative oxidoreductase
MSGETMMKAASLLFLRVSTGLLVVLWGLIKLMKPEAAIGVSNKYYGGIVSADMLQAPWGAFQVAVGLLVILGLSRKIVYPLQALILCLGALAIWKYLLDPYGMYLFAKPEDANLLFFPSLAVAAATLVVWAFKDEDHIALDVKLQRR